MTTNKFNRKMFLISLGIGAFVAALFFVPGLVSADEDGYRAESVFGHCYIEGWNGDWGLINETQRTACGNPEEPLAEAPEAVVLAPKLTSSELDSVANVAAAELGLSVDIDLTDYRAIDAALLSIAKAASKEMGLSDALDLADYRAIDAALAEPRW